MGCRWVLAHAVRHPDSPPHTHTHLRQMDGIHGKLENVLTIGATNLAQDLDQALLRPGRFEVSGWA